MSKRTITDQKEGETFGQRLARFRKEIGYSQRALADMIGISQRVIAYYETETEFPPTHLLPLLANALKVSADELLGLEPQELKINRNSKMWRRFTEITTLPQAQQQQLAAIIDAFLEGERLRNLKSA